MTDMPRNPSPLIGKANASIAAAFALSLLACAWLSWPALPGPFLFDDLPNLRHLSALAGQLDWRSLAHYMSQYESEPGRPLSMLSFVINDYAWPSDPWGFKYTNLMLHLLVGVLVFGFARCLAQLRTNARRTDLAALLSMAAWLLHPMQLSTTMLVVQRMTQLSALFVLAALWGYATIARRASTLPRALAAIAVLGIGTVLAVLCKETGALPPLLAVVVNVTLLRGRLRELPVSSRRVLHWGALLPIVLLVAAIGWRWNALTDYGTRDFNMYQRLLTEARVLVNYLYQILVPNLRGGGIYHDDFIVSRSMVEPWTTLPAIVLITGLLTSALALVRRKPLFAFAVLWFFGAHLLESTVFPLEIYFEHRNYLPMFGPLFALALWIAKAAGQWRRAALIIAIAWIFYAAWLTWVQAPIWGDERKFTAVWAIEHPHSARAVQQRADYLYRHRSGAMAANTLLDAYRRGVSGTDFPMQALNIACVQNDLGLAADSWPLVKVSLAHGRHDNALLLTIGRMRRQSQDKMCPQILTEDEWLALTEALLANPQYARGEDSKYLHVERSYLFRHRRDLNATMRELEAAWAAGPAPDLAQLIAATLASAGLYDEAGVWANRALDHRVKGIRGWLSMDDVKSERLRRALKTAERRSGAQAETAPME